MRVRMPLCRPESRTAVGGADSPGSGCQKARTRASSRSLSIEVLLTWLNASRSPQRSGTGMWRRRPAGAVSSVAVGSSVTRELAVGGAMRLGRLGSEALDLVLLVRLEVALEPVPLVGVFVGALVGEDVRRDAVEEPPVVRDDHGAAGEFEQGVLERLQRLDV